MKIVVSYLSSLYDKMKTIRLIDSTSADGIHVDLMDGIYAGVKNFELQYLKELFKDINKPLDIHLMLNSPDAYLDELLKLNPDCIYIHPSTDQTLISSLNKLESFSVKKGIVINPDENIDDFNHYYPYVDRVLLMSVTPGCGGQKFLDNTKEKLKALSKKREEYGFEIFVDGGINDETITFVTLADGVVSGSFICMSKDYEQSINKLRK